MALLTILLLVFAFVFSSFGSSSSGSSSGSAEQIKPVVKCSQRMPAAKLPPAQERRCGPPPANP